MKVESSVRGYFFSSLNSDIRGRGRGGGSSHRIRLLSEFTSSRNVSSAAASWIALCEIRKAAGRPQRCWGTQRRADREWPGRVARTDALRRRAEDEPDRDAAAATASLAEVAAEAAL